MGEFVVNGYIAIAINDQTRIVEERSVADCSKHGWCHKKGIYIFYCGGKKRVPVYVGKTKRTIRKEAFDVEKIKKINDYISTSPSCELRMLTITPRANPRKKRAKRRQRHRIGEMERCLISLAAIRNKALINRKELKSLGSCFTASGWAIRGAIHSSKKPKRKNMHQTRLFRKLMGIER